MSHVHLHVQFYEIGEQTWLQLGDQQVEYNPACRLYLSSRLTQPSLSASLAGVVAISQWDATPEECQQHLLHLLVDCEQPQLEADRISLQHSMANTAQLVQVGLCRAVAGQLVTACRACLPFPKICLPSASSVDNAVML